MHEPGLQDIVIASADQVEHQRESKITLDTYDQEPGLFSKLLHLDGKDIKNFGCNTIFPVFLAWSYVDEYYDVCIF